MNERNGNDNGHVSWGKLLVVVGMLMGAIAWFGQGMTTTRDDLAELRNAFGSRITAEEIKSKTFERDVEEIKLNVREVNGKLDKILQTWRIK